MCLHRLRIGARDNQSREALLEFFGKFFRNPRFPLSAIEKMPVATSGGFLAEGKQQVRTVDAPRQSVPMPASQPALEADTHLIVQSSEYVLWGRGEVVYCQTLPDKTFAIGLELTARTGDWIMRSLV